MAPGLPDRVDCAHLADNAVALERVYPLGEMPRLQDLLADVQGYVRARFAFAKFAGRPGVTVSVESVPRLLCQRCLQGFAFAAAGSSEIEFSCRADGAAADPQREVYAMDEGRVSLRELAEEELLLALPSVARHASRCCGQAPFEAHEEIQEGPRGRSRPFAGLQDLLKKT